MKSQSAQFFVEGVLCDAQIIEGVLWLKTDEGIQTLDLRNRFQTQNAGQKDGKTITAPMPGKIIKIITEAGSDLAVNDTVIVMEAMKMEYQLKAVKGGTVRKISVQVGDQVQLGQLLAEIEVG